MNNQNVTNRSHDPASEVDAFWETFEIAAKQLLTGATYKDPDPFYQSASLRWRVWTAIDQSVSGLDTQVKFMEHR